MSFQPPQQQVAAMAELLHRHLEYEELFTSAFLSQSIAAKPAAAALRVNAEAFISQDYTSEQSEVACGKHAFFCR